jgi:hypothetical protein
MSMADLEHALGIIAANPGLAHFVGPRSLALVAAAEQALGGRLPPTYREFVCRLGAGSFGAFEVCGVISDDFENSAWPNGVCASLNDRRQFGLPETLVMVGTTGYGPDYCVELRDGRESPVFIYQSGHPEEQDGEVVAKDFGEFFLTGVREQL